MARFRIRPRWTVLLIAAGTAIAAAVVVPSAVSDRPDAAVEGIAAGDTVSPETLRAARITSRHGLDGLTVTLDGEPVRTRTGRDALRPDPERLGEGRHTLRVAPPSDAALFGTDPVEITFRVDATPPTLRVDPPEPVEKGGWGEIRGTAVGAATVTAGDEKTRPGEDGKFVLPVRQDGGTSVTVTATDAAGNTATEEVPVTLRHPGMRAVHMSASAWASATLREPVMELVRERRIDTVQLDIKDESGKVGYSSQVPLAQEIGANADLYDAREALDTLHAEGVHVVGRLVAFRDPVLGRASWESGDHQRLVQDTGGSPWSGYGSYSFTNFADPEVREYNIALAEEAAELGFDDILYDYIRRPDGDIDAMRFPGLETSPEESVADFLAESRQALHEHGAYQGASVFGIAATRPTQIAQDIPMMSEHVDYIAPMVYPSHWGPGEYGVDDPNNQPYDITRRSVADFVDQANENGTTKIIPWLQAFSLGVDYGAGEIRAQIEAVEDAGTDSFLLWNAACRYDASALAPT